MHVMRRLQGVATVVSEFHRIWDQPVAATKFAQLIEFCWYFIIRYRAFVELLQNGTLIRAETITPRNVLDQAC